jgi:hypothetical protein
MLANLDKVTKMAKHYGSSIFQYVDGQVIRFTSCSCGWQSEKIALAEDVTIDLAYRSDYKNVADYLLDLHLKGVACESFDD